MQHHADFTTILHSQRTLQGPNRKKLIKIERLYKINARESNYLDERSVGENLLKIWRKFRIKTC